MNLSEEYLPRGYTSHNAMGEHGLKHHGDVVTASYLRQQCLVIETNEQQRQDFIRRINERQTGLGKDNQGDFVFVCPVKPDGQWLEACAYGITRLDTLGAFAMRATVEELVVAEEHRGKGIATWILHKLGSQRYASTVYASPTELVVDRTIGPDGESFADRLINEVGRTDENNNPVIWLPGHDVRAPVAKYEELLTKMPDNYTGVLELFPETDEEMSFQEIYRDGNVFARIEPVDELDEDGFRRKKITYTTGQEAIGSGFDMDLYLRVLNNSGLANRV